MAPPINWMKVLLDAGVSGVQQLNQIAKTAAGRAWFLEQFMTKAEIKAAERVGANAARAFVRPPTSVPASWAGEGGAAVAEGGGAVAEGIAGGGASAVAVAALPIVTYAGLLAVWGGGYYQARQQFKKHEALLGFSHGFVTAILGWKWNQAIGLRRRYLSINQFDATMDDIRVNAYNDGLYHGFLGGLALPADAKKNYRIKLRQLAGRALPSDRDWNANSLQETEQMRAQHFRYDYVDDLARAGQKHGIITN